MPGCGTGEISLRLAEMFRHARILGIDIIDDHLERARARCAALKDRVRFENRSIFELGLPEASFDLTDGANL
jgi:ubiquinone/menaquinone biosynthesis C-methylase UbiE